MRRPAYLGMSVHSHSGALLLQLLPVILDVGLKLLHNHVGQSLILEPILLLHLQRLQ